jgi:hypothetical protein
MFAANWGTDSIFFGQIKAEQAILLSANRL